MQNKTGHYYQTARQILGLTQKELADELSISLVTLSKIEHNQPVSQPTMSRIDHRLNLHKNENITVKFDYLSVSFGFSNTEYVAENILGLSLDYLSNDSVKWLTYTKHTASNVNGSIFVGEMARGDGTFLNLTGQGIREMEHYFARQQRTWVEVFEQVIKNNGNVTRLDIAIDDKLPFVNLLVLANKVRRGEYYSRAKKAEVMGGLFNTIDGVYQQVSGVSIYLGSRSSNFMINLYQKDWEQVQNKATKAECLTDTAVKNRYELRLRQQLANHFLQTWLKQTQIVPDEEKLSITSQLAFSYLNDYLWFLTDGEHDKTGIRYAPWDLLTSDYEPVHVKLAGEPLDIEKTIKAMLKVWAPKFSVVKTIDDTLGTHWLDDILAEAATRRSEKDEALLRTAILDPNHYLSPNRDRYYLR
jgi:transcriptional regulator with XRE-family HTH domain